MTAVHVVRVAEIHEHMVKCFDRTYADYVECEKENACRRYLTGFDYSCTRKKGHSDAHHAGNSTRCMGAFREMNAAEYEALIESITKQHSIDVISLKTELRENVKNHSDIMKKVYPVTSAWETAGLIVYSNEAGVIGAAKKFKITFKNYQVRGDNKVYPIPDAERVTTYCYLVAYFDAYNNFLRYGYLNLAKSDKSLTYHARNDYVCTGDADIPQPRFNDGVSIVTSLKRVAEILAVINEGGLMHSTSLPRRQKRLLRRIRRACSACCERKINCKC